MSFKVLLIFTTLCFFGSCFGDEETTKKALSRQEDTHEEPLGVPSVPDIQKDPGFWRFWRFWSWTRSMVNRMLTHSAESADSLAGRHRIHQDRPKQKLKNKEGSGQSHIMRPDSNHESNKTPRALPSAYHFPGATESSTSTLTRTSGSVERELVTSLFESMLDCIVDSWEVTSQKQELLPKDNFDRKIKPQTIKLDRKKRTSRIKSLDLPELYQPNPMQIIWWSQPDEKAIIHFKNGNIYDGNISYKCMNGKGRFQWADGSVYQVTRILGEFKDNTITGKGKLLWKDECWYEGDFLGYLRHGKGLYVDSQREHSYYGNWDHGTKHGNGVMYYSADLTNYYDGEWQKNVRRGHGIREYCRRSGYKGDWDFSLRNGKGTMIWPNGDFYTGDWKNGLISGSGRYLWDVYFNNTMTLPALISYDGQWLNGNRNGFGTLELGFQMGTFYQGEFKDMMKQGQGHFVTNNGLILTATELFADDRLGTNINGQNTGPDLHKKTQLQEPYHHLKLYDNLAGLRYHIKAALMNLDRESEIRGHILRKYFESNKSLEDNLPKNNCLVNKYDQSGFDLDGFIIFEEYSLLNQIKFYEARLRDIYEMYANTGTEKKVAFSPVMIRLFLWQFYYDCEIHEWGLSLVDIDNMFHKNREFLSMTPHDPFESIQFWQFLHSLIMVSNELFAKRHLPGPKPETILAEAFKYFMDNVALLSYGRFKGYLKQFGPIVPLKGMYKLYRSIGEPHSIRDFLCAARRSPILIDKPQPQLVDAPDTTPRGRNIYLFGDKMVYIINDVFGKICPDELGNDEVIKKELTLHNFGNLSSESIIRMFANILPDVCTDNKVQNLDVQYTFLEFYQAFIACAEESVRVTEEEKRWRDLIGVQKVNEVMKVEHWEFAGLAEPKENYVYRDGLSNLVSTYLRLGSEDYGTGNTETRHMLKQIFTKTDPVYSFKPLVNFTSYPCTDTPQRNKLMKKAELPQLPPDFGVMDYVTTNQENYRVPYPATTKPLTMASPPWLMNRVICSDLTQNYGTAPPHGNYQCLDTHTPIGHIRQMRLPRNRSFNPATCLKDFPPITTPLNANQNKTVATSSI